MLGGPPLTLQDFESRFIDGIIPAAIALAGLACFIYILIGGFKYLTAGGDDKALQSAKNTLTFAFIGLFLVIGSYAFFTTILSTQVLNFGRIRFDIP